MARYEMEKVFSNRLFILCAHAGNRMVQNTYFLRVLMQWRQIAFTVFAFPYQLLSGFVCKQAFRRTE